MMVIIDQVGSESVKCFFGRGFSRIGKSKAFFSQSPQSTRRKAGLNVKRFSHRVRGAHGEKRIGKSKSKAFFSQSSQRKAGLKVKSISLTELSEATEKGGLESQNQKHIHHQTQRKTNYF